MKKFKRFIKRHSARIVIYLLLLLFTQYNIYYFYGSFNAYLYIYVILPYLTFFFIRDYIKDAKIEDINERINNLLEIIETIQKVKK